VSLLLARNLRRSRACATPREMQRVTRIAQGLAIYGTKKRLLRSILYVISLALVITASGNWRAAYISAYTHAHTYTCAIWNSDDQRACADTRRFLSAQSKENSKATAIPTTAMREREREGIIFLNFYRLARSRGRNARRSRTAVRRDRRNRGTKVSRRFRGVLDNAIASRSRK